MCTGQGRNGFHKHAIAAWGALAILWLSIFSIRPAAATHLTGDPPPPQSPNDLPVNSPEAAALLYMPFIANNSMEVTEDLSDGWYLMIDDGHIQSRDVQRVYHPFRKYSGNPIIQADKPWEGKAIQLYGSVLPGFKMWYSSYNYDGNPSSQVLYAVSLDGLHWAKPGVGGSSSNALFGGQNAAMVSVLRTQFDPARPYKLVAYQNGGFNGHWTFDGMQTFPYPENPLFANGSDVAQFYWDPYTGQYGGTTKESAPLRGDTRRVVRFIRSDDLIGWDPVGEVLAPDIIDDQIYPGLYPNFYGLPVFAIGEQYLGLLWVLKAREPSGLTGKISIQLVSSHDGVSWTREEGNRPAILDVGPPGAWDDGQLYTATQPLRVEDELWLYYSGCNMEHGASLRDTVCSIGLAKAPYHRLASLSGSGTILTEPLDPSGPALRLNYDGSEGSLQVELVRGGVVIPGYEAANCLLLVADSQDAVVAWQRQAGLPAGPFQIRFYLQNAALFAFAFKD
jgi:hypothetical protein